MPTDLDFEMMRRKMDASGSPPPVECYCSGACRSPPYRCPAALRHRELSKWVDSFMGQFRRVRVKAWRTPNQDGVGRDDIAP